MFPILWNKFDVQIKNKNLKLVLTVAWDTLPIRHVCLSIFLTDHHTNMINIIFIKNELAKFILFTGTYKKSKEGRKKPTFMICKIRQLIVPPKKEDKRSNVWPNYTNWRQISFYYDVNQDILAKRFNIFLLFEDIISCFYGWQLGIHMISKQI